MQFMVMHKMTDEMEKGLPPDPAVIERIGQLIQEGLKDNVFVSGEGLKPSAERVRLAYQGGKRTLTKGPFSEPRQLPGGFSVLRVRSQEEAIAWCDRFAAVLGDVELVLGPVVEAWDLGFMPKPDNAPLRFLSMQELDERAAQAPPSPELQAKLSALIDEMTRAGVLQASGALAGTQRGARVRFKAGKHTVIDGPFAESKELVAGYSILNLPSKTAAIGWAVRFAEIVQVNEVEIRELA